MGVVDRLLGLRHDAVIGSHHQDDDVGDLGAAGALAVLGTVLASSRWASPASAAPDASRTWLAIASYVVLSSRSDSARSGTNSTPV